MELEKKILEFGWEDPSVAVRDTDDFKSNNYYRLIGLRSIHRTFVEKMGSVVVHDHFLDIVSEMNDMLIQDAILITRRIHLEDDYFHVKVALLLKCQQCAKDWFYLLSSKFPQSLSFPSPREFVFSLSFDSFLDLVPSLERKDAIRERIESLLSSLTDLSHKNLCSMKKSLLFSSIDKQKIDRELMRRVERKDVSNECVKGKSTIIVHNAPTQKWERSDLRSLAVEKDPLPMSLSYDRKAEAILIDSNIKMCQTFQESLKKVSCVERCPLTITYGHSPAYRHAFTLVYYGGRIVSDSFSYLREIAYALLLSIITKDLDSQRDRHWRTALQLREKFPQIFSFVWSNWLFLISKIVLTKISYEGRVGNLDELKTYDGGDEVIKDLKEIINNMPKKSLPSSSKVSPFSIFLFHRPFPGSLPFFSVSHLVTCILCLQHYDFPQDIVSIFMEEISYIFSQNGPNLLSYDLDLTVRKDYKLSRDERIREVGWVSDIANHVKRISKTSGAFSRELTFFRGRGVGIRFGQLGFGRFRECTGNMPKLNNFYVFVNVPDDHNMQIRLTLEVPAYAVRTPFQISIAKVEKVVGLHMTSSVQNRFLPPFDYRKWTCFRVLGRSFKDFSTNVIWATLYDNEGLIGSRPFMLSCSTYSYANVECHHICSDLATVSDNMLKMVGYSPVSRMALIEGVVGLGAYVENY
jgi:hypothetical protein